MGIKKSLSHSFIRSPHSPVLFVSVDQASGGLSRKWRESSVLHLLVHVENAQHTAQDGFLGLLGSNAVPDVAQCRAKVGSACREASPEELCHWACQSATEEPDNQGPQQDENCWHAAWLCSAKKKKKSSKKEGKRGGLVTRGDEVTTSPLSLSLSLCLSLSLPLCQERQSEEGAVKPGCQNFPSEPEQKICSDKRRGVMESKGETSVRPLQSQLILLWGNILSWNKLSHTHPLWLYLSSTLRCRGTDSALRCSAKNSETKNVFQRQQVCKNKIQGKIWKERTSFRGSCERLSVQEWEWSPQLRASSFPEAVVTQVSAEWDRAALWLCSLNLRTAGTTSVWGQITVKQMMTPTTSWWWQGFNRAHVWLMDWNGRGGVRVSGEQGLLRRADSRENICKAQRRICFHRWKLSQKRNPHSSLCCPLTRPQHLVRRLSEAV